MKFYFVNGDHPFNPPYYGKLDEAQRGAREIAATSVDAVEVESVEVGTDRTAILNLLNVGPGAHTSLGVVYTAKGKKRREAP